MQMLSMVAAHSCFGKIYRPVGRFFCGGWGGGGFDPTTRRTKRAPGVRDSRGKWGHAPREILKIRLSENATRAF